jgi:hypothetical protein
MIKLTQIIPTLDSFIVIASVGAIAATGLG